MSRIYTMARFDDTTIEPKIVGECECCGAEFYEYEEVVKWDGCLFCNTVCLLGTLDYTYITLDE